MADIRFTGGLSAYISWDEDHVEPSFYYEDFGNVTQTIEFEDVDDVYHNDVTIAPNTTEIFRLDNLVGQLFNRGYTKTFESVRALQIRNLSLLTEILIDQDITNPVDFLPVAATIGTSGVFQLEGLYPISLPADGIGIRNPSGLPVVIHLTILGTHNS